MKKLLIVEEHPAPYRDETFQEIITRGYNIRIISAIKKGNRDNHAEWDYHSPLNTSRVFSPKVFNTRIGAYRKGFLEEVSKYKPDVLCTSSILEGILFKFLYHKRVVLRSDNIKEGKNAKSRFNYHIFSKLLTVADAFWVPGLAAEKFYRRYVKKDIKICHGAYTYDACRIINELNDQKKYRTIIRHSLGISDGEVVFLFIGKLIPTRHVEVLLKCISTINNNYLEKKIKFIIIGDGPMEEDVIRCSNECQIVTYIPKVPIREIEKYYAISDAYIHPGEEPYSLALYEAAVAALPIISSDKVGAVWDCLQDKLNGLLYEFCSEKDLLTKVIDAYDNYSALKQNAIKTQKHIIDERGTKWAADQLIEACEL